MVALIQQLTSFHGVTSLKVEDVETIPRNTSDGQDTSWYQRLSLRIVQTTADGVEFSTDITLFSRDEVSIETTQPE